jgi:ceramide glucosyltransferase
MSIAVLLGLGTPAASVVTATLTVGAFASVCSTALTHACVHWKLRRRTAHEGYAPPISILKPLKGVDDGLEENLASLATQDYPGRFEIVLGAADPDDPALDVALRLRRDFPEVTIKIVAGRQRPGLNPKVQNLMAMSDVASSDTILISDSNVRVGPTYLRDIAREMADPEVGLVSNLIAGQGERTFGAALENLHLNSFVAGAVCGADLVARHPVVVGKSMLMRLSDLERLGGWKRVADVLGEDYLLGTAFAQAGHKVVLSSHVIRTVNTSWALRRFMSRHLRWSQLRRWVAPGAYVFEPLLNPLPWLMTLALVVWLRSGAFGSSASTMLGALAVFGVGKVASDALLSRRLRGQWPPLSGLAAVPAKDAVVFFLWCLAWVYRSVDWRGNKFRIGRGSALSAPLRRPDPAVATGSATSALSVPGG